MDNDENNISNEVIAAYDKFVATEDLTPTLNAFKSLCETLEVNPKNHKTVFNLLKTKLKSWKCQNLFNKLEKKGKHKDYNHKPCAKLKVLVVGAGPVGLRTAIECAYLGAYVIVVEKRNTFSRNNVLHLWPYLIVDLKSLGIKSFFGKFCAGTLDHISIRRLQVILLKVCLILGVQVHTHTMVENLVECTEGKGWRVDVKPSSSPLNLVEIDAIIGCDGKNNVLQYKRKEFRGKLAIAITCNFVNKKTSEENRVEEISGVAFIYNQEFFQQLYERTGIELENIVYYKDETHYFVMTAKKRSLLQKGVIKQDSKDVFKLLSMENVNHEKLCDFGRESADFSTKYQLPHHEFARNHYGKEDVALFDFTSIHQAEHASRIIERKGKRLMMCIAGDLLLEPFWPTGSGCARGFLGGMDAAWMLRGFGLGMEPVDLIQERESIFTLLPQTKPDSLMQSFEKYSINPQTRYCNLNTRILAKEQAANYYDCSDVPVILNNIDLKNERMSKPIEVKKPDVNADIILKWCMEQTADYSNVNITNFSTSWKNGLGFCAIISRYRPDLIDFSALDPHAIESNCKKAFSKAEEHLGIPPKISARDFATQNAPDTLAIMAYVSLYYEALKNETPVKLEASKESSDINLSDKNGLTEPKIVKVASKMAILSKLSRKTRKKQKKAAKSNKEKKLLQDEDKSLMKINEQSPPSPLLSNGVREHDNVPNGIKVSASSTKLNTSQVKIENNHNESTPILKEKATYDSGPEKFRRISQLAETVFGDTIVQMGSGSLPPNQQKVEKSELAESEKCYFCQRKVFIMERQSAEGLFFHRKCFRCFICKCQLLLGNYVFHVDEEDQINNGRFFCKMHYNRMIYEAEKNADLKTPDKKRPCSALLNGQATSVVQNGVPRVRATTSVNHDTPKPFSKTNDIQLKSKVGEIQCKLRENLPEIKLPNQVDDRNELNKTSILNTYDKLYARQLDRHPSLLKCGARKVTTNSFFTASKHSISTPNLSKLIQEDSMFQKEREEHATTVTKNILLANTKNNGKNTSKNQNTLHKSSLENSMHISRSLQSLESLEIQTKKKDIMRDDCTRLKHLSPKCSISDRPTDLGKIKNNLEYSFEGTIGAVDRRPMSERRAQYPVSMAFSDGIVNAAFRPVSVVIDLEESYDADKSTLESKNGIKDNDYTSKPKRKLVLKKKKKLKPSKELTESPEDLPINGKVVGGGVLVSVQPAPTRESAVADGKVNTAIRQEQEAPSIPYAMPESEDSTSSSEDERILTIKSKKKFGKKVKKQLAKEREAKEARKNERRIKKEMKGREMKRLWEAQGIQRKLDEVDVRQNDLEAKAKKLESDLYDDTTSPERKKQLTFDWFSLVNEKNVLLRFESELVIASNSIQLEDRQQRLDEQIRSLLTNPKRSSQKEIERLTKEHVDTVEQRNQLVELLEEDRLREMAEDKCINVTFAKKAHDLGMDRLI